MHAEIVRLSLHHVDIKIVKDEQTVSTLSFDDAPEYRFFRLIS